MSGCVTLSRHTRELISQGVSRTVDEFTTAPGGPRLLVRLNRTTGEIDARVISGSRRTKDLRTWAVKSDATPGDVARLLFDLAAGAFGRPPAATTP